MRRTIVGVGVLLFCLPGSTRAGDKEARAMVKKYVPGGASDFIITGGTSGTGAVKHIRFQTDVFKNVSNDDLKALVGLQLETLDLRGCPYVGDAGLMNIKMPRVEHLGNLKYLVLSNTRVTGKLTMLGNLKNILDIELDDCANLTDASLTHYAAFKTLKSLSLDQTNVSDTGLKYLAHLTKLTNLELRGTKVLGTGLNVPPQGMKERGFANLQSLNLSGCGVSDRTIMPLQVLKKLTSLALFKTNVSLGGMQVLKRSLPGCRILTDIKGEPGYALARAQ